MSVSIIVLILSIVLTQQGVFNNAVLLRSQAYEVALDIRQIQMSAVSATNDATGGGEEFRSVLGIYFTTSATGNQQYQFFVDRDGDNFFDAGEEWGTPGFFDPRFKLGAIRLESGSVSAGGDLSIVFERPNFDAKFETANNTGDTPLSTSWVALDVVPDGLEYENVSGCPDDVRTVQVTSTGQVTVVEC